MTKHASVRALAAMGTVAMLLAGALVPAAYAVTLVWQNAGGGQAGVAANWNPAQVPAEADLLRFDLAGAYTVTFGAAADSVTVHQFAAGDVTLAFSVPHGIRNLFSVATDPGQVAIARLTSGTLRIGGLANIGTGAGATGTLRVNGGGSNLYQNVTGGLPTGPVLNIGGNASSGGTGEVVVGGGGVVELAEDLHVGRHAGGTGTLRVRGAGNSGTGVRRSRVVSDASTADCTVGTEGGHGVLEVLDGGLFRFGRDLFAASGAGDVGEITVGGENVIDSSEVHVKDDLLLGASTSGLAGQAGGTATMVLDSLGVLVVDDSTVVGDVDGGTASLTLRPHARMTTKHLLVREPTGTPLALEGGLLQVNGGRLETASGAFVLTGTPSTPTVELLNGATASPTAITPNHPLVVGATAPAVLRIAGESEVAASGGESVIGEQYLAQGAVEVHGGGRLSSTAAMVVGQSGHGSLICDSGASGTFGGLDIGRFTTGSGYVRLAGAGTSVGCTGRLNIGGGLLTRGGTASMIIDDGATFDLDAGNIAGTHWGGTLYVGPGARMNMSGTFNQYGLIQVNDAHFEGGTIAMHPGCTTAAKGVLASGITGVPDTLTTLQVDGALELGRDDLHVAIPGRISIGPYDVTIHDPDSAMVGTVELEGGSLTLPSGGGVIPLDRRLVGCGRIHGPLVPHGYLIATTTTFSGLEFDGMLRGTGQGAGGTRFTFRAGGGFEGAGLLDAAVTADSGSLIRATGDLTFGVPTTTLVLGGRIEAGSHHVTFRDTDQVGIAGTLSLDGGTVEPWGVGNGFYVNPDARIEGRGTVDGYLQVFVGHIAPGPAVGRLQVNGDLVLGAATVEIDLGDHGAGEWDTLTVSGTAALTGTLALRRLPSFAAAVGDSFQVLACGGLDGALDSFQFVTLDGEPADGIVEVHYAPDGAWVVVLQSTTGAGDPGPAPPARLALAPCGSPGASPGVDLALPVAAAVHIDAYDAGGRQVGRLHDGVLGPGRHRFTIERCSGGPGVYFVRATVAEDGRPTVYTVRVVRLR